jgi:hypothetical protein
VRGDEAAHLSPLGAGPDDLGSRFERIAALAFGRLGVPAASRIVTRAHLREFFTAPGVKGLADEIANGYFSPGTLPEPARVGPEVHPRLSRALPALPARLNLMAASRDEGMVLRDASGTCLARYKVEHNLVTFAIDDDCMLEQVTAILPEVAAYETGMLDFLLRGELTIAQSAGQTVVVSGKGLGVGSVEVLVEDERGVRTKIASSQTLFARGGDAPIELARIALPSSGTRLVAVFRGADTAGEPIVAVGALPLGTR